MTEQRSDETKIKKTSSQLRDEINKLKKKLPEFELRAPQIFFTDATPEAAENALVEQRGRITQLSDEGNLFDILGGLYTGGKQNIDVYLKGHSGGSLRVKRGHRIADLPKIALSVGLAVQPAVLSEQADTDKRKFRGKGLYGRFIFYFPRSNIGSRDITKSVPIPDDVRKAYWQGIKSLLNIQPKLNDLGIEEPRIVDFSPDAKETWLRFSQYVENNQGGLGKFARISDFTGKLPGTGGRIAAIVHIAEKYGSLSSISSLSDGEGIQKDSLEKVLDACEIFTEHTTVAFDLMGDDLVVADAKYSYKWILASVQRDDKGAYFIKHNDLHCTPRFKNSKSERVKLAMAVLNDRNITSPLIKLPTKKPTYIYYVRPDIFAGKGGQHGVA